MYRLASLIQVVVDIPCADMAGDSEFESSQYGYAKEDIESLHSIIHRTIEILCYDVTTLSAAELLLLLSEGSRVAPQERDIEVALHIEQNERRIQNTFCSWHGDHK